MSKKLRSSQTGFLNLYWTQIASAVTGFQSSTFGMVRLGYSHHVEMDQNLWGMNLALKTKEGISKVYLINLVYITIIIYSFTFLLLLYYFVSYAIEEQNNKDVLLQFLFISAAVWLKKSNQNWHLSSDVSLLIFRWCFKPLKWETESEIHISLTLIFRESQDLFKRKKAAIKMSHLVLRRKMRAFEDKNPSHTDKFTHTFYYWLE